MDIRVRLEKDEDRVWVATCPSLPGCISQGKNKQEALKNIKAAITLHLKCLTEDGIPLVQSKSVEEALVEVHV